MDRTAGYAFHTYDQLYGFSGELTPLDCFAANLLSLRLRHNDVIPLFQGGNGAPAALRASMQRVLDETDGSEVFAELPSIDEPPFRLVRNANWHTEAVDIWTAVTVSKVLHRLRPQLVPVYDSHVRAFYEVPRNLARFYATVHADMQTNRDLLAELAHGRLTPDGRPISELRVLDIVVWHHVRSQCNGAPR